jgi:hypothetical protein
MRSIGSPRAFSLQDARLVSSAAEAGDQFHPDAVARSLHAQRPPAVRGVRMQPALAPRKVCARQRQHPRFGDARQRARRAVVARDLTQHRRDRRPRCGRTGGGLAAGAERRPTAPGQRGSEPAPTERHADVQARAWEGAGQQRREFGQRGAQTRPGACRGGEPQVNGVADEAPCAIRKRAAVDLAMQGDRAGARPAAQEGLEARCVEAQRETSVVARSRHAARLSARVQGAETRPIQPAMWSTTAASTVPARR